MNKEPKILRFPAPPTKADYQRVKSTYSVEEIKNLFGLSERLIRRWTEQGVVRAAEGHTEGSEPVYDFQSLTQFRKVRDLRAQGLTLKQVEAELQGQMNLFKPGPTRVTHLLSPFEEALMLHERDYKRAAQLYRDAVAEGDNVADAYCNLGILELEGGNVSAALDCLTLSLKHEPRHAEAHYNLGNVYFDAGDLRLAKLHYESAAELQPSFAAPYFNCALVHYRLNDFSSACGALQKYKELMSGDGEPSEVDSLLHWLEKARDLETRSGNRRV